MRSRRRLASLLVLLSSVALVGPVTPAVSAPDPTPAVASVGAAGVGDRLFPRAGNGGYDVRHYGLQLRWRPADERLEGTARITARATQRLSRFNLDLYGLRVASVRVQGRPARWSRDGQELRVTPARTVAAGDRMVVLVRYAGTPRTFTDPDGSSEGWIPTADGAVVVNEPLGAMTVFPANNHPTDKATYDVRVTVPRGLRAVSNGRVLDPVRRERVTTFRFRQRDPMATYLTTFSIGRYRTYADRVPGGPRVRFWVDPNVDGPAARTAVRQTVRVVQQLSKRFGPYPFDTVGGFIDPSRAGYALEVQNYPYYPSPPGRSLIVHEIAHQWYGNHVSPNAWGQIWLNEGWATYAEWIAAGDERAQFAGVYSRPASDGFWRPAPGALPDASQLFSAPVYVRGAMTLHVLRREVGDRDFFRIARAWVREFGGGAADTRDLRLLAERISGEQLTEVFDDWVLTPGKPRGYGSRG